MAMLAMAVPILPGMTETWDEEIMGRIRSDKAAVDAVRTPPAFTKGRFCNGPRMGTS